MQKFTAVILSAALILTLTACGNKDTADTETTFPAVTTKETTTAETNESTQKDYDSIPDEMVSENGRYEIAFVTDIGQLKDKSFNEACWNAIKSYAYENDITYKYYQPSGGDKATDEDRYNAMKSAADSGGEYILAAGYLQSGAIKKAAVEYPDKRFIFIDGNEVKDDKGKDIKNVAVVNFSEEQSGFLAGFAAVKEGFTKLGFSGGGGGSNPSCCRYGYGFVQGAQAAAKEENTNVDMRYSWEYGSTFSASPELQTMLNGWYSSGTQVVFSCGGGMCLSAFQAAAENDGYVIGADADLSSQSETVLTCAMKNLTESVFTLIEKSYDNPDDILGKQTALGIKENAVGLATDKWRMKKFTQEDYSQLLKALEDGDVTVDRNYEKNLKQENFDRVKLITD